MAKERVLFAAAAMWAISASAAQALDWRTQRLRDEFTDIETCRVEPGGAFSRAFVRGMTGAFRTLHFFAENRNGEVRAGFMSEPLIPIPGDIQLRVDANPFITLTAVDTPLDAAPAINIPDTPGITPEMRTAMEQSIRSTMAMASPYRVLTGDRARALLRAILSGEETRWRVVTINAAASATGTLQTRGLSDALEECGISIAADSTQ